MAVTKALGHETVSKASTDNEAFCAISQSAIDRNGGGIDYGLDGPTANSFDDSRRPPNHPIVEDARYDPASNAPTASGRFRNIEWRLRRLPRSARHTLRVTLVSRDGT